MTVWGLGQGVAYAASAEVDPLTNPSRPLRTTVTLSAAWLPSSGPSPMRVTTPAAPVRPGRQVVRLGSPAAPPVAPHRRAAAGPRMTIATLAPRIAPDRSAAGRLALVAPTTNPGAELPRAAPSPAVLPHRGTSARWSAKGPARLVWTGFKSAEGTSEVAFQVTKPVTPKVVQRPGRVVLVLPKCRLQGRLAGKALDTRYFAGSVDGIAPHQKGQNVEIDVRLRRQVDASEPARREGPRGSSLWVLGLPSSGAATPSEAVAEASPHRRTGHRR